MSEHACACLHAPGYKPRHCQCGVYVDQDGRRWCANENCRAELPDAPDWREQLVDLVAYTLGVEKKS